MSEEVDNGFEFGEEEKEEEDEEVAPVYNPNIRNDQYENEQYKLISELSKDKSLKEIITFIRESDFTVRSLRKLTAYAKVLLDPEFAVSRIADYEDLLRLKDQKALLDADLPLGLVRFDITPEFMQTINMINIKWDIKIRRSMGGFERKAIITSRTEGFSEQKTGNQPQKKGIANKVRGLFGD